MAERHASPSFVLIPPVEPESLPTEDLLQQAEACISAAEQRYVENN